MYITEDYGFNSKQLAKFSDIVEAFQHLLQWPNKCNLFFKPSNNQSAILLAWKE